ncbi:GNAT family N-acetyltransferase [Roseateles sp. DAIF2]|uniref:GNAT family N-acetyltransferase n=1 Tax=Roseateles sp. DAIF2 TaxID=2714952 RepID=UPI0018A31948|nr:GNAT family N-acetyltransferase [Roseateles sp. DAIF2]QPF75913.1 GNAT family N-acetyltransferase [Roseateles sp. DAIF2]
MTSRPSAQDLTLVPASEPAPERLHAAFIAAFADYLIGPFTLGFEQWPQFRARQGVDLALSRVALGADGEILAFAFVAPRAGCWRLATMGALPAARGSGAAPRLLDDFIERARAAGQGAVELEVFAQNERALRLYRGRGFEPLHELQGHVAAPGVVAPAAGAAIRVVPPAEALAWLEAAEARIAGLPLQVGAVALRVATGMTAWQLGRAQLMFGRPDAQQQIAIASLIDTGPEQADARALVQALRAEFPQATLRVPQLQRADLGGAALRALGFAPLPLHQLLMRREF